MLFRAMFKYLAATSFSSLITCTFAITGVNLRSGEYIIMATPKNQLSLAKAQETFFYDDTDGTLYWKIRPSNKVTWGVKAGNLHKATGYYQVMFDRKTYKLHNVVWNWHFGEIPEGKTVDHIDGDKSNNQINNLRLATARQQQLNRNQKGYYWNKKHKKWKARHKKNGRRVFLGLFNTEEEARAAYLNAISEEDRAFVIGDLATA